MKKVISFFILLTLTLSFLVFPVSAGQNPDLPITFDPTYLRTSYCPDDYLELSIYNGELTVEGVLSVPDLTDVGIGICVGGDYINKSYCKAQSGQVFSLNVALGATPCSFTLWTFLNDSDTGWSYCHKTIIIDQKDGKYFFVKSLVADSNASIYNTWQDLRRNLDTTVYPDIKELSDQIVGDETDDYKKLFLIHSWIADNIYYDFDFFNGKTFDLDYKAGEVIASRLTVCEGYANLAQSLIRAQGIPCMIIRSYALGYGNEGTFALPNSDYTTTSNDHVHVEAFVDGRWVIMDPTWDSRNTYENGTFTHESPNGYYYFDVAPETFALDHKILIRGEAKINSENELELSDYYTYPSEWAEAEVNSAIDSGTVPYLLRGRYQDGITREETAKLLISLIEEASGMNIDKYLSDKGVTIGESPFNDTSDKCVLYCNALNIIKGVKEDTFSPDTILTREQIAALLCRTAHVLGIETNNYTHDFVDVEGRWCSDELGWPSAMGIIKGVGSNRFNPDGTLTREQAIAVVYRAFCTITSASR